MKHQVRVGDLSPLIRSRGQLLADGWSERGIGTAVAGRSLVHLRRGWYIAAQDWDGLWAEGRHLAHVIAVLRDAGSPAVMSHVSAAVLWGLPLYLIDPRRVHVTMPRRCRISSSRDVLRHTADLPDDDVVRREGVACTSLGRTVADLVRMLPPEAAVAVADAAERQMAMRGRVWDQGARQAWREELAERLEQSRGGRGVRRGRRVAAFADGRAQLPGESVSRLQLVRLGFAVPELQVAIPGPTGSEYFVDFRLADVGTLGEFDGKTKYLDEAMRRGRPLEHVLLEEKQREDWIRGITQERFVRWGDADIRSAQSLGERLAGFGVLPPT